MNATFLSTTCVSCDDDAMIGYTRCRSCNDKKTRDVATPKTKGALALAAFATAFEAIKHFEKGAS